MTALLAFLFSLLTRLGEPSWRVHYAEAPADRAQTHAGGRAQFASGAWSQASGQLLADAQRRWKSLRTTLASEIALLPRPTEPLDADESQISVQASYGKIPEVRVDFGTGAIFPMPFKSPDRYSWYQVALRSAALLESLSHLETDLASWKSLPLEQRLANHPSLATRFANVHQEFVQVASRVRYLESWLPELRRIRDLAERRGDLPLGEKLVLLGNGSSIQQGDRTDSASDAVMERLREAFRPKRVLKRLFLPDDLARFRGSTVTLPIATDVADPKFLREFEGAVDTHWNRSPWARNQGIEFRIRWIPVPADAKFAHGIYDLREHIGSFPAGPAVLTTGGLTLHVRDRALILGPDPVDSRTLAHEFGHLLGFEDCYFRTLSSQGPYGEAVLEWSNPIYPDELMCDNTVGVVRAVVW